jgi:hypothetical protein
MFLECICVKHMELLTFNGLIVSLDNKIDQSFRSKHFVSAINTASFLFLARLACPPTCSTPVQLQPVFSNKRYRLSNPSIFLRFYSVPLSRTKSSVYMCQTHEIIDI